MTRRGTRSFTGASLYRPPTLTCGRAEGGRIAGIHEAYAEVGVDPTLAQHCIQTTHMEFAQGDTVALLRGEERPAAITALGMRILAGILRAAAELRTTILGSDAIGVDRSRNKVGERSGDRGEYRAPSAVNKRYRDRPVAQRCVIGQIIGCVCDKTQAGTKE